MRREPLRVPRNWQGEDRQFVIQLERVLDNILTRLGDKNDDIEQEVADLQETVTEIQGDVSDLDTGKKDTQTAVADPEASGSALAFIDSISQDTQGVITPTKKNVSVANNVTTTTSGSVLDARQGKALQDAIDTVDGKIFVPSSTNSNLSDKSIANDTVVNLGSVTVNKGLYIFFGTATFAANTTGYRRLIFADSSTGTSWDRFSVFSVGASQNGVTQLQFAWAVNISSNSTKVYLNARQTSGGSLGITYPGIRYVKLS